METISLEGEELEVPVSLLEDHDVFTQVLSEDTWRNVLTEEDRTSLKSLLPRTTGDPQPDSEIQTLKLLFSGDNVRFGNPVQQFWEKLHSGCLSPEVTASREHLRNLKRHQYELSEQARYVHLLKELLLSQQHLLQDALFTGALENLPSHKNKPEKRKRESKFTKLLRQIREECNQGSGYVSSDDEPVTNQIADPTVVTEEDYREMLHTHRKRRKADLKVTSLEQAVRGLEMKQNPDFSRSMLPRRARDRDHVTSKRTKRDKESDRPPVMHRSHRVDGMDVDPDTSRAVYEVYRPLDNGGSTVDPPLEPLRIEGPLPVGKFMSFFSLLRHIFKDILDGKGELNKLMKNVRLALKSPEASSCSWLRRRPDWPLLTLSALCYLAAEVGAVSSFSPLPHFIPLIEFRDRIDHWKWIGSGRDSDEELLILYNHWLENLKKALPVVDYSEYEPPPPHVWTNYTFRPSSQKEILKFRQLERERYASPQKAFTYSVHGFEAPVGPVKGSRSSKKEASSKARGHALLIPQRPTCVTILSLVRDATSRMPNGEGTRIDLCVLVQDSQYLADNVSDTQLNNAVSGALDRLHYEKDPCVRYDGSRKVWIYLHRGRNEEDFERIFWACEVAANQRKRLMSRPRIKPKIIMSVDGREVLLDQGGAVPPTDEPPTKPEKKKGGKGTSTSSAPPKSAPGRSGVGVVTATLIPSDGHVTVPVVARETGTQPSADKPRRKRKPSQKLAEQQQKPSKRLPPPLTAMPTTSLQSSDWGSSGDEEQVLPFLDSSLSLMPTEDKLSQDSGSSWHSSDSGGEEGVAIATESNPSYSAPTRRISSGLLQSSPVVTTPTFMNESSDGGSTHFVTLTPTQNFLPATPTVATPTFIPDIGIGDEGDVLSQQLGEKSAWLSSGSTTPE